MNIVFNIVKSKNLKMNMTYEQFVIHASDLRNHSCSIDDDWNLQEYRNPMVSQKTETKHFQHLLPKRLNLFGKKSFFVNCL